MIFRGTIAHIPARSESRSLPKKSLRLMAGQPMLSYAVQAARQMSGLDGVYVNTDDADIAALGQALGAKIHHRPPSLAEDDALSDDFNAEVISALQPQTLMMINPSYPLLTADLLSAALSAYSYARETDGVDALISGNITHAQAFYAGKPINVSVEDGVCLSLDNPEVMMVNWAISIWDGPAFLDRYQRFGFGVWGARRLFYPLSRWQAVKVSTEDDFMMCEALLLAQKQRQKAPPQAPAFWVSGQAIEA